MITKITFLSCEKSENVNCKKKKQKKTQKNLELAANLIHINEENRDNLRLM